MPLNFVITGGGRGIGLELARQLVKLPKSQVSTVYVTTRNSPPPALQELITSSGGRLVNIHCEVTNKSSVQEAAAEIESKVGDQGVDVLINNVGTQPVTPGGITAMEGEILANTFDVNVTSVHRMTSALLPAVRRGKEKKIIMISTTVGSIAYAKRFMMAPVPEYKITKAALNMLIVQYALQLKEEGLAVFGISPGWLKTDMGSQYADLDVEVGASAVKDIIFKTGLDSSGKLLNIHVPGWEHADGPNQYDGAEVPW